MGLRILVAALVSVMFTYSQASADPWVVAEVPAAFAVSTPQRDVFRGGALPAVGVYGRAAPYLALAVRVRAGVLGDASTSMNPTTGLTAPGWGGLGTVSLAMRASAAGAWLEATAGGGVTGTDVVPTFELGAGWRSRTGAMEVGPSLRLLHVRGGDGLGMGSADLVLIGLEVRRARSARVRPPRPAVVERQAPAAPEVAPRDRDRLVDVTTGCADDPASCARAEPDGDAVIDVAETCAMLAESMTDLDAEGCASGGPIEVTPERIVLSEHVLFNVNRARVKRAGRPVIRGIASAWRQSGWDRIIVEGHADTRGSSAHNLWLSQLRAERARAALVEAGVPPEAIEAVGHGATRPRSHEHERNRRVEFVVVSRPADTRSEP